uniref:CSON004174 protein n=1 Tax=Culicoides sonorensis TaxID=179676 RepID=A0A336L4Q6_CULSO
MIIKEINIVGSRTFGKSIKITLDPEYNHINCDDVSLPIVKNALGIFFNPEIALKKQNSNDFSKDAFIQIYVDNADRIKLKGFERYRKLKFIWKVNQSKITITNDESLSHTCSIQEFHNRIAHSGISIPYPFISNVEKVFTWLDCASISNWAVLNFADLWQHIYQDVLCHTKYEDLEEWIIRTREAEFYDRLNFEYHRDNMVEKLESMVESVTIMEEYTNLYKKVEGLKALIEDSKSKSQEDVRKELLIRKNSLQNEINDLEIQKHSKPDFDDLVEILIEKSYKTEIHYFELENDMSTFNCNNFNQIGNEQELDYGNFLENLLKTVKSVQSCFLNYQIRTQEAIDHEIQLQSKKEQFKIEESKMIAINLFTQELFDDGDEYVSDLKSIVENTDTIEILEQNVIESKNELDLFELEYKNSIIAIEHDLNTIQNLKIAINEISTVIETEILELHSLKLKKIELEEKFDNLRDYFIKSGQFIPHISKIDGLVAMETLLEDVDSSLSDHFKFLLVREIIWEEDDDTVFSLECFSSFSKIVVSDQSSVREFQSKLPSKYEYSFVCLDDLPEFDENLPRLRRARHRNICSPDQHIESSSLDKTLIMKLINHEVKFNENSYLWNSIQFDSQLCSEILLCSSQENKKLNSKELKRRLYFDDNTFETENGVIGGGHIFITVKLIQKKIIEYLDISKKLREISKNIQMMDEKLLEHKQKMQTIIHDTELNFKFNENSFKHNFIEIDQYLNCFRAWKLHQSHIDSVKSILDWIDNVEEITVETKTEIETRKSELKNDISVLEMEYESILIAKQGSYTKLLKQNLEIMKLHDEFYSKYGLVDHCDILMMDFGIFSTFKAGYENIIKRFQSILNQNNIIEYEKEIDRLIKRSEITDFDQMITNKRLEFLRIISQISDITTNIEPLTKNRPTASNQIKKSLFSEFPSLNEQLAELTKVQSHSVMNEFKQFLSPTQVNMQIMSMKTEIQKIKDLITSYSEWPTGFVDNVFIMKHKASGIALKCFLDFVVKFSRVILSDNVNFDMWAVIGRENSSKIKENLNFDLSYVRELCYCFTERNTSTDEQIQENKQLIMLLLFLGIFCYFKVPFIIVDQIFEMFDSCYWDRIATVFKKLSKKRQIIVINGFSHKWTEDLQPNKVNIVRKNAEITNYNEASDRQEPDSNNAVLELQKNMNSLLI